MDPSFFMGAPQIESEKGSLQRSLNDIYTILNKYDVDCSNGFLPDLPPLKRLPNNYYNEWETLMDDFNHYMLAGTIHTKIEQLPLLSTKYLKNQRELQRAFVVLTFLTNGYVWSGSSPREKIPRNLAIPLTQVSKILGVNPISCYASLVLWNWKLLDETKPFDLNNLATLHTYTGTSDESWFYLITLMIEYVGAKAIPIIMNMFDLVKRDDLDELTLCLEKMKEILIHVVEVMRKMFDRCDPYIFYNKIRVYQSGWKNMTERNLSKGVWYEGTDDLSYRQYSGGSAGQSSLIHLLDVGLGIHHTGSAKAPTKEFIMEMRTYMPKNHRRLLDDLSLEENVGDYLRRLPTIPYKLNDAYNQCIDQMKLFREIHIQMVTRYIVNQARKNPEVKLLEKPAVPSTNKEEISETLGENKTIKTSNRLERYINYVTGFNLGSYLMRFFTTPQTTTPIPNESSTEAQSVIRGTGGTDAVHLLKQTRDETKRSYLLS